MNGHPGIGSVAVAGAGTMGSGIALVFARGGCPTVLYDVDEQRLEAAMRQIRAFFERSVEKGRLSVEGAEDALARLVPTTELEQAGEVDLLVEAVFEDIGVKRDLLQAFDAVCGPATIFASNTSTLSIAELARASGRPSQFAGLHFCLPAQLMKLVEVTPGLDTSDEAFAAVWEVALRVGQLPIKTQDRPGFVLNHFVVPFNNDAIRMVERGVASPEHIDRALTTALGYPMGPLVLLDLIGLDTQVLLSEALFNSTYDPRAACPPLLRRMVAAGRLGRKKGHGFYVYEGNAMFGA